MNNSFLELLQQQKSEFSNAKLEQMKELKKKKQQGLRQAKKAVKDGLVHQPQFKYCKALGNLFSKPLLNDPNTRLEIPKHEPEWFPTNTNSRLFSPCAADTTQTPRQKPDKEKLWRPFSSSTLRGRNIQLLPHSAKPNARVAILNLNARDVDTHLTHMKPFLPTKRIGSAFTVL